MSLSEDSGESCENSFLKLGLSQRLIIHLENVLKITKATPIQEEAIPVLLKGRDTLIKSRTGSGKTLSYLLPIMQMLSSITPVPKRSDGTLILIITPTRELCIQIANVASLLARIYQPWLIVGTVMGGEKKKSEKSRLRKGVTLLVGTPGRVIDHIQNTKSFQLVPRWLVLDEADRLLDFGFEEELKNIFFAIDHRVITHPQSILLSATLPSSLDWIRFSILNHPCIISSTNTLPSGLVQSHIIVDSKLRLITLIALLQNRITPHFKAIIFFATCDSVAFHSLLFRKVSRLFDEFVLLNTTIYELHGNLPQKERTETFLRFSKTESGILLCTDVAARGLDLPYVDTIIQYDPPENTNDYIHRVGRTARMENKGEAILFLLPVGDYLFLTSHLLIEETFLNEIRDFKITPLNLKSLFDSLKVKKHRKSQYSYIQELQKRLMHLVDSDMSLSGLASNAFMSFCGAYTSFSIQMRNFFHIKNLHLGHVAHSFALQNPPSKISNRNLKMKNVKKRKRTISSVGNQDESTERKVGKKYSHMKKELSYGNIKQRKRKKNILIK